MNDLIVKNKVGNKDNKAFMILSALGILFVVDEHLGRPISFFSQIFPYDSFYMPLFVFVSGYFFNFKYCDGLQSAVSFAWKKTKKILFPFLGWAVFYAFFTAVLRRAGIIWFGGLGIKGSVIALLTTGASFGFNDPSWFVLTLFTVSVLYCLLRTLFNKYWNDIAAMICFVLIGALAVYAANTQFNESQHFMLLKATFFIQFFQLGIFFKRYLETAFDKINGIILCLLCIIINVWLLAVYGNRLAFPNCAWMGGFLTGNPFLPLITSITGISFWLKISKLSVSALGNNSLINYISDNTFFIMTHHLTAKALFNTLLIFGKNIGISALSMVDIDAFKASAWYLFSTYPWVKILCFLFTVAVALLMCLLWNKIKGFLNNAIRRFDLKGEHLT